MVVNQYLKNRLEKVRFPTLLSHTTNVEKSSMINFSCHFFRCPFLSVFSRPLSGDPRLDTTKSKDFLNSVKKTCELKWGLMCYQMVIKWLWFTRHYVQRIHFEDHDASIWHISRNVDGVLVHWVVHITLDYHSWRDLRSDGSEVPVKYPASYSGYRYTAR